MRRILFVFAGALLLVSLVLAFVDPISMIAPGRLIEGHEKLEDDCFACHRPFLGSQSGKCVECHDPEKIGLFSTLDVPLPDGTVNFHQHLLEDDCMACHSDHPGRGHGHMMPDFSHGLLDESTRSNCASCHEKPDDRLHRSMQRECSTCHSVSAWTPADFDHKRYFRLDRDHDVACDTCHVQEDYSEYTCYGCHEHRQSRIRAEHLEEGIRDFENCVECHKSANEHEAERIWKKMRKEKSISGGDHDE